MLVPWVGLISERPDLLHLNRTSGLLSPTCLNPRDPERLLIATHSFQLSICERLKAANEPSYTLPSTGQFIIRNGPPPRAAPPPRHCWRVLEPGEGDWNSQKLDVSGSTQKRTCRLA